MRRHKVEPLPCPRCNTIPVFFPEPTEEFPTSYKAVCPCNDSNEDFDPALFYNHFSYSFGYKTKSAAGLGNRRISLNNAIRSWNRNKSENLKHVQYKELNVTCKFCKTPNLTWGKRSYKSAWKGASDYVLYESVTLDTDTCPLTGSKRIKYVVHNCLATSNIKHIEYIKP